MVVPVLILSEVRVGYRKDRADLDLAFFFQSFLLIFTFTCLLIVDMRYGTTIRHGATPCDVIHHVDLGLKRAVCM
jgi:hypothetical protein